jgi:hypothetical protein
MNFSKFGLCMDFGQWPCTVLGSLEVAVMLGYKLCIFIIDCSLFLINCDVGILDVFTVQVGFGYSMMFPVLILKFASCELNMGFGCIFVELSKG